MTQVQLDRHPFAKHRFYKGTYTHNSIGYPFTFTVEESVNSIQPYITVEFKIETELLPFSYDKAYKEIIAIYSPDGNQETKD
jgi:hypothetical protein